MPWHNEGVSEKALDTSAKRWGVVQEPGAGSVITYPRNLEGVVRKKDDRRRTAREARAERKAAEATALEEEVKRRKAEKRRELDQRCADGPAGCLQNLGAFNSLACSDQTTFRWDYLLQHA